MYIYDISSLRVNEFKLTRQIADNNFVHHKEHETFCRVVSPYIEIT